MIREVEKNLLFKIKIRATTYTVEVQSHDDYNGNRYFRIDPISLYYKWRFWDKYHIWNPCAEAKRIFPDFYDSVHSNCSYPAFKTRESAIKFLYYMDRRYNPNFYDNQGIFINYLKWTN